MEERPKCVICDKSVEKGRKTLCTVCAVRKLSLLNYQQILLFGYLTILLLILLEKMFLFLHLVL